MKKRFIATLVALMLVLTSLLAGCSKATEEKQAKKDEPVELVYYFVNGPQKDLATVEKKN